MAQRKGVTEDVRRSLRIDVSKVHSCKGNRRFSFELASVHGDQPFDPNLSQESTQASAFPSHEVNKDVEVIVEGKCVSEELPLALIPSKGESPYSRSVAEQCVCVYGRDATDMKWIEKHLRMLDFTISRWILTRTNKQFVYLEGGLPERQRLLRRGVLALMKEGRAPCLVLLTDPSLDKDLSACLSDPLDHTKDSPCESAAENGVGRTRQIVQRIEWRQLAKWISAFLLSMLKDLACPTTRNLGPLIKSQNTY